jgi:hypothetical protein
VAELEDLCTQVADRLLGMEGELLGDLRHQLPISAIRRAQHSDQDEVTVACISRGSARGDQPERSPSSFTSLPEDSYGRIRPS